MLPSHTPNYASQLDYSWNDLRLKAEYVMQDARVIMEYTKATITYSQRLLDDQRKQDPIPARAGSVIPRGLSPGPAAKGRQSV
jgi:hypothetical protein